MRAVLAVCVLVAVGCTGPIGQPAARATPQKLASGGVVEYPVPDPIAPGASCFGCGQASPRRIVACPQEIAAAPDGNPCVTGAFSTRIGRMTPAGTLTEFPLPMARSNPRAIVAGPDGNLWFTEASWSQPVIGRITPAGSVTEYRLDVPAGAYPREMGVWPDHHLWVPPPHGKISQP